MQDQCKKEFEYAERTKGADKLISVVMEPSVRKSDPGLRAGASNPNPNPNPNRSPNPSCLHNFEVPISNSQAG